jgi:predicted flavoprotein YhiN
VPLVTEESWPRELAGLTLKNITLTAEKKGKTVFSELGELLFTHFGISGPLVLSLSGVIAGQPAGTRLSIDLKPRSRANSSTRGLCGTAGSARSR